MAQVIQALCDVHLNEDQQLVGSTFVINVNGRLRAIELCGACEAELLAPLDAVLKDLGRKADASDMPSPVRESRANANVNGGRSMTCPVDGEVCKSRAGLAIHARHKHEMSVEALLGEAPNLGMMKCTFPDCNGKSVSRGAVATHVLNKHHLTLAELEQLYGPVMASLDNNTSSATGEVSDQYICLDCTPPRKFNMSAGLHSHRRNKHPNIQKDRVVV